MELAWVPVGAPSCSHSPSAAGRAKCCWPCRNAPTTRLPSCCLMSMGRPSIRLPRMFFALRYLGSP